eukprot:1137612-Pelagomonas_calceolata.AAC.3
MGAYVFISYGWKECSIWFMLVRLCGPNVDGAGLLKKSGTVYLRPKLNGLHLKIDNGILLLIGIWGMQKILVFQTCTKRQAHLELADLGSSKYAVMSNFAVGHWGNVLVGGTCRDLCGDCGKDQWDSLWHMSGEPGRLGPSNHACSGLCRLVQPDCCTNCIASLKRPAWRAVLVAESTGAGVLNRSRQD